MNKQDWTDLMNDLGEQYGKLEEHPFIKPEVKEYLLEKANHEHLHDRPTEDKG